MFGGSWLTWIVHHWYEWMSEWMNICIFSGNFSSRFCLRDLTCFPWVLWWWIGGGGLVVVLVVVCIIKMIASSVLWCCWLGLLTCKTHYRVGEPTAAWRFVDICQHWSFDNGRQFVSCGQRQLPLSDAAVNKMAVNYNEGEMDPSGLRVWWNSSSLRDICPPYRQCLTGSSWQQQQQMIVRIWFSLPFVTVSWAS